MTGFWKRIKNGANSVRKRLTAYDIFGIPIGVNYKGESSYKSFFGFLCSCVVVTAILAYSYAGSKKLVDRKEPDRAYFMVTNSRTKEDAFSMPDNNGQMYIALGKKTEYKDGS